MAEQYLGDQIKKLGFGLMRLPMAGDKIDLEETKKMVDLYISKGFTYFDTAYVYTDGQSELAVKEVLIKRHERQSFQLATKMPEWCAKTKEDVAKIFQEQLDRTGAGYFDFYLLHAMDKHKAASYEKLGIWDFVKEQKAKGLIKHYGFSFHDSAECLEELLAKHCDAEFVQLQINYCDWDDPMIQSRKCYNVARKHNKPVIIMEPVKGGTLAALTPELANIFKQADPDKSVASWALRFAASLEGVITILSGMSTMEQVADNVSFMSDITPLSKKEQDIIKDVTSKLRGLSLIPCTNCEYCLAGCPQKIKIPSLFSTCNNHDIFHDFDAAKEDYQTHTSGSGKASGCIACGNCEASCPQHIHIIAELKKAAALFE